MREEVVPRIKYEQLALGELAVGEAEKLRLQDDFEERMKAIEESNLAIQEQHPGERMASLILERLTEETDIGPDALENRALEKTQPSIKRFVFNNRRGITLLAAALILITVGFSSFFFRTAEIQNPAENGIRIKGLEPIIQIYRQSSGGPEKLRNKDTAKELDLLQISYNAAGKEYGSVVSIDGHGVVTLHFPDRDVDSPTLKREGEIFLSSSYRLDDAPDFERFFFVTSDTSFAVDVILEAARELVESKTRGLEGELRLPLGFEQTSKLLNKESK